LREIKKGEVLRASNSGIMSPVNKVQNGRIHSFSQYNDQKENKSQLQARILQNLDIMSNSKGAAFKDNLKPLNKIQTEAFNQI
jgi:hypothetical protein